MFKIIVKTTAPREELEKFKEKEMLQFIKALKSCEDIAYLMKKPVLTKVFTRKGYSLEEIEKNLEFFTNGYSFDIDINKEELVLTWVNHYWIDYPKDKEEFYYITYKPFEKWKHLWSFQKELVNKIQSFLRLPNFWLPKVNEPTVSEKHRNSLVEEITKRFKNMDKACVIDWEFKEEKLKEVDGK